MEKEVTQLSEIVINKNLKPQIFGRFKVIALFFLSVQWNWRQWTLRLTINTSSLHLFYFFICLLYALSQAVLDAYMTMKLIKLRVVEQPAKHG